MNIPLLAGAISTVLFAASYLPMLVKAARTRDLSSYSLVNIATTNVANGLYSVYVFSLPIGPIWFLHAFYLLASALMLVWFLRFRAAQPHSSRSADVAPRDVARRRPRPAVYHGGPGPLLRGSAAVARH